MRASMSTPVDDPTRALLAELKRWSAEGWIRRLDSAFADFIVDLCPQSDAPVVLAASLLAHVEGHGHSCLPVSHLVDDASGLLALPPPAAAALQALLPTLPSTPAGWLAALRASPLVMVDDWTDAQVAGAANAPAAEAAAAESQPLVLRGDKLYLRRYWQHERAVATGAIQRANGSLPVDRGAARAWLDRLFVRPSGAGSAGGNSVSANTSTSGSSDAGNTNGNSTDHFDWQKAACGLALSGRLSVITGGPGTGKTYTAARLLALLFAIDPAPERLRIALAAPTGKAAARLRQAIGDALEQMQQALGEALPLAAELAERIGPARTLHSLLGARPDTRRFSHDAAHPLEVDVLIVDEASMIHLEMMAALFDALPPGARLILLGDKDQLASVEAGAVLGDLCRDAERGRYQPATAALLTELTGDDLPERFIDAGGPALSQHTVMLRSSRRFGGPIGELALAVNRGDRNAAETLLSAPPDGSLRWIAAATIAPLVRLATAGSARSAHSSDATGPSNYRPYLDSLKQRPRGPYVGSDAGADTDIDTHGRAFDAWVMSVLQAFERFRVLCAVRDGDWGTVALNLAIESALLAEAARGGRSSGSGGWYEGRPILVTRNDAALGVFNGDIGIVLRPLAASQRDPATALSPSTSTHTSTGSGPSIRQPGLRAFFADGDSRYRSVATSRLAHVETAFAMTVHKAQGSEFDHCALVLPQAPSRVLTRELVYTGITRAKRVFTLVTGRREALGEALGKRTVRASGLVGRLERPAGAADFDDG